MRRIAIVFFLTLGFSLGGFVPSFAQDKGPASAVLAAKVQPFVENHSLAGAAMLVSNAEKTLALETAGFADIGAKQPMKPDSLFWIASMTKPITGTATMLLVDDGKVSLDDPVEKFLPEFKNMKLKDGSAPSRLITVRDILNHTSGLPFKSSKEAPTLDCLPLREAVLSYTEGTLDFQPGTKYQYSNAGINTAGRIIEVVSGMSYEAFLETRLFKPLGMIDTTFFPSEAQVARLAKAYKPNAAKDNLEETTIGQLKYPLTEKARYPMPGGGLFSTATDLGFFCRMVLNKGMHNGTRILSEKASEQMTSRQTPSDLKDSYGVGWSVGGDNCGHGGALATNMNIDRRRGLITIWLVQHAGFPGEGGKAQGEFRKAAEERFGTR